jgi:hypothetical protein
MMDIKITKGVLIAAIITICAVVVDGASTKKLQR